MKSRAGQLLPVVAFGHPIFLWDFAPISYRDWKISMAMDISTDELKKAVQTLEEALQFAQQVHSNEVQFKIARDACIQRFEYCIELSWKVSVKKLGSLVKFPKQAVREMARADLITSAEAWLDFIEARNSSSHSYDEETAQKVFTQILLFRTDVQNLIKKLDQLT